MWVQGPPPKDKPSIGWLANQFQYRKTLQPYKVAYCEDTNDLAIYSLEGNEWIRWGTILEELMVCHCSIPMPKLAEFEGVDTGETIYRMPVKTTPT